MSLDTVLLWQKRARPNPTTKDISMAVGCHAEEFLEMLEALEPTVELLAAMKAVADLADLWKSGAHYVHVKDREALLDSLADQIVTAVGVGHCLNMHTLGALAEVNSSNWSKFVDGQPVFNANGKIKKGPNYVEPNLKGMF